ncbi:MAG: pyrroline-5-carboxylate reductase [Deltaproteobacteria bacterium]|nr:pyrroline-5-carboxylate reductase [Deltaproteobacteria bacterium]MBW2133902.1 pyrroline-5-carboxylate reductase [Deltaproteobacteria bacterium]
METEKRLGIIGVGNMGESLLKGWLKAGLTEPELIRVFDLSSERRKMARQQYGVQIATDNLDLVRTAEILLLAVKPQGLAQVLAEIRPQVKKSHLVISIAAGIPISFLEEFLPTARIIRVMPNTPTMVQAGMAALAPGSRATADDLQLALKLFQAVGEAVVVEEKHLDAVTGLSGSGPAYVLVFLEALADGGVKMGLTRETALLLAGQTLLGAAQLVLQSQRHPAQLKDSVTSPGGTTIAGLHVLEQGAFRGLVMSAVEAATRRAQELGQTALNP